jgi:fructoselysine-6-P-deglycase FrlB-like protein
VGSGLHPWARLPLLVYPAHALALTLALARGRDPDAPRHLGQVVILDPA